MPRAKQALDDVNQGASGAGDGARSANRGEPSRGPRSSSATARAQRGEAGGARGQTGKAALGKKEVASAREATGDLAPAPPDKRHQGGADALSGSHSFARAEAEPSGPRRATGTGKSSRRPGKAEGTARTGAEEVEAGQVVRVATKKPKVDASHVKPATKAEAPGKPEPATKAEPSRKAERDSSSTSAQSASTVAGRPSEAKRAPTKANVGALASQDSPANKASTLEPSREAAGREAAGREAAAVEGANFQGQSVPKPATGAQGEAGPSEVNNASRESFFLRQRELLLAERNNYTRQAEELRAQAEALALEHEPGDVQFDEEGGEGGTANVDREIDLQLSAQARAAIEEIDAALAKIDAGTYGLCETCGTPIPEARLEALPQARLCVRCKSGGLAARRH